LNENGNCNYKIGEFSESSVLPGVNLDFVLGLFASDGEVFHRVVTSDLGEHSQQQRTCLKVELTKESDRVSQRERERENKKKEMVKEDYLFAIDGFEARARGRRRRRAAGRRRQRSSTLSFSSVAHISFAVLLFLFFLFLFFCSMSVTEGLCLMQMHSSIHHPSLFGLGPRINIFS